MQKKTIYERVLLGRTRRSRDGLKESCTCRRWRAGPPPSPLARPQGGGGSASQAESGITWICDSITSAFMLSQRILVQFLQTWKKWPALRLSLSRKYFLKGYLFSKEMKNNIIKERNECVFVPARQSHILGPFCFSQQADVRNCNKCARLNFIFRASSSSGSKLSSCAAAWQNFCVVFNTCQ